MKKKSSIKNRIYDAICTVVPEFTGSQFLQGLNFGLCIAILIWMIASFIVYW